MMEKNDKGKTFVSKGDYLSKKKSLPQKKFYKWEKKNWNDFEPSLRGNISIRRAKRILEKGLHDEKKNIIKTVSFDILANVPANINLVISGLSLGTSLPISGPLGLGLEVFEGVYDHGNAAGRNIKHRFEMKKLTYYLREAYRAQCQIKPDKNHKLLYDRLSYLHFLYGGQLDTRDNTLIEKVAIKGLQSPVRRLVVMGARIPQGIAKGFGGELLDQIPVLMNSASYMASMLRFSELSALSEIYNQFPGLPEDLKFEGLNPDFSREDILETFKKWKKDNPTLSVLINAGEWLLRHDSTIGTRLLNLTSNVGQLPQRLARVLTPTARELDRITGRN